MRMSLFVPSLVVVTLSLTTPTAATATPVTLGVWNFFQWGPDGIAHQPSPLSPEAVAYGLVDPGPTPWEFELGDVGVVLTVQDFAAFGDRFEVFSSGTSLGLTSEPGFVGAGPPGFDFNAAALNPDYSWGIFYFAAHSVVSITIHAVENPYGGGGAAFRFDCSEFPGGGVTEGCFPGPHQFVPDPGSSMLLLGMGLVGLRVCRNPWS